MDEDKFSTKPMNTKNPFSYDTLRKDLNKTRDEAVFWSDSDTVLNLDPEMNTIVRQTIQQLQGAIAEVSSDAFQAKVLSKSASDKADLFDDRIKRTEEHSVTSPVIGEFDGSWASTANVKDVEERLYDAEVKLEELNKAYGGLTNLDELKQATADAQKARDDLKALIRKVETDLEPLVDAAKNVSDAKVDTLGNTHETLQGRLIEDFRRVTDLIDETQYTDREGFSIEEIGTSLGGYTKDLNLIGNTYENLINGNSRPDTELPYGAGSDNKDITLSNTTEGGTLQISSIKGQTYNNLLEDAGQADRLISYSPDRSTSYTIDNAISGQSILVKTVEGASYKDILEGANIASTLADDEDTSTAVTLPVVPPRGTNSQYNNAEEGIANISSISGYTYKNYVQGTSSEAVKTNYLPNDGETATISNPEASSVIIESIQGRTLENLALGEMYAEQKISLSTENEIDNLVIEDEGEEIFVTNMKGKTVQNILTGFDTSPILTGDNYMVKHSENSEGIQERTGDYQHMVLKGNTLKNVGTGRGETSLVHHNSCNTNNGGTEYAGLVRDDCDVHEFTINGQTVQNLFDEVGETVLLSTDKSEVLAEQNLNTNREYLTNMINLDNLTEKTASNDSSICGYSLLTKQFHFITNLEREDPYNYSYYSQRNKSFLLEDLKLNQTYTLLWDYEKINDIDITNTNITVGLSNNIYGAVSTEYKHVNIIAKKLVFTTLNEYPEDIIFRFAFKIVNSNNSIEYKIKFCLLEGDYSDIDIPFFEDTYNKVVVKEQEPVHHGYLYGRTLKNLKVISYKPYVPSVSASSISNTTETTARSAKYTINTDGIYNAYGSVQVNMLKPSTTYICKAKYINSKNVNISTISLKGMTSQTQCRENVIKLEENLFKFNTISDIDTSTNYNLIFEVSNGTQSYVSGDTIEFGDVVLLEYQQGMENWNLPYFEGMKSVENPIITMTDGTNTSKLIPYTGTGKNLVMRSLPNGLADQLNITTGTLVKSIEEIVFNGSEDEDWGVRSFNENNTECLIFSINISNKANNRANNYNINLFPGIYSDIITVANIEGVFTGGDSYAFFVNIKKSRLLSPDITGFKTWLGSNNLVLQYQLKNPEIIKIGLLNEGSSELQGKVKLPNGTCDTYNIETLNYTHNLREITYSGISSEDWSIGTGQNLTNTTGFSIAVSTDLVKPNDPSTIATILQDSFLTLKPSNQVWRIDEEGICVNSNSNLIVRINKLRFAKTDDLLADFKVWLNKNPITIIYGLATPTTDSNVILDSIKDSVKPNDLLTYNTLQLSSNTAILPRLDYTLPSLNSYSMRRFTPGNTYTLVCPDSGNTICGTNVYGKGEFTIPSDTLPNDCLVLGIPQERLMCFDKDYGYTYGDYIDSELHVNGDNQEIVTVRSTGKNLFNKNTVLYDKLFETTNGALINDSLYVTSDYIPVKQNTNYYINGLTVVASYNKNKVFNKIIRDIKDPGIFETDDNCYFILLRNWVPTSSRDDKINIVNSTILAESSLEVPYEAYKESVTQVVLDKPLRKVNDQYKDTLTFKDGKLVHTQNIGRVYANKDLFRTPGDTRYGWSDYTYTYTLQSYNTNISTSFNNNEPEISRPSTTNYYSYTYVAPITGNKYGFGVHENRLYPFLKVSRQLFGESVLYDINSDKYSEAYFQDYPNIEILYPLVNPIVTEYNLPTNVKQYANGHIIVEGLNYDTSVDAIYNSAKCHKVDHLTPGDYTILCEYNNQLISLTQEDINNGYKQTDLEYPQPIIIEGDHRGKYIPYFNGLLSCEAPIVKSVGKNLLDFANLYNGHYEVQEDGSYKLNKDSYSIYSKINMLEGIKAQNLKLTFDINILDSNKPLHLKQIDHISELPVYPYFKNIGFNKRSNNLNNLKSVNIVSGANGIGDWYLRDIQLELSTTATSYAPYVESKLTLPETVILRSLPDGTCDEYDVKTRTYTQRVGYVKLTNTTTTKWDITEFNNTVAFSKANLIPGAANIRSASDKVIISTNIRYSYNRSDYEHMYIDTGRLQFFIDKNKLSSFDSDGFNKLLQINPIHIQYALEEPIVTVLEDETIPTVLKCYEEGSLIFNSAKSLSLHPKVEYKVPSYNYFDTPLLTLDRYKVFGGATGAVSLQISNTTSLNSITNQAVTVNSKNDNIVKTTGYTKVRDLQMIRGTADYNKGIQGIRSLGDEGYLDIIVHGKNYFNLDKLEAYYDYEDPTCTSTFEVKNGRLEIKRTYGVDYGVRFNPTYRTITNTTNHTLSFIVQTGTGIWRRLERGIAYDTIITEGNTYSMSITDTTDIVFLNTVNQSSLVISNIMLNEGTNAIAYEPYVEDVLRVPLVNGPLNAINSDIYDEIDIDPDRMEATIIRRTKKYKFNNIDSNWSIKKFDDSDIYRFSAPTNSVMGSNVSSTTEDRKLIICNKLPSRDGWASAEEGCYVDTSVCAKVKAESQQDAIKKLFIDNNGLIIIVILSAPTYETVQLIKPNDKLYEDGHIIASSDGITPLLEITTK